MCAPRQVETIEVNKQGFLLVLITILTTYEQVDIVVEQNSVYFN